MYKRILKSFIVLVIVSSINVFAKTTASNIKSVNFLQEGEVSKLIIQLDEDAIAEKQHVKDDKQIILDLKNVKAEKKFLRGIDASEFSGSIDFISPYKKPGSKNDLRFAIQLRDNVRSFIERKPKQIILHMENRFGVFTRAKLKKASEQNVGKGSSGVATNSDEKVLIPKSNNLEDILENLTQSGVKRYVGKKVSINVNSIPYQDVFKMLADTSGFNIIIDDEVNRLPPLTISLTNLPWDRVLDTIMDLGDLVAFKHGNILTIKTLDQARKDKQKELESENKNKVLEPLVTKIFPISYAEITDLSKIVADYSTKDRGSIQVDKRTRNMIVKDTIEVIERIKKIIETLDTQTAQILIEAKIVEATENYEFKAGLGRRGINFSYDPVRPSSNLPTNVGSFSFNSATDSEFSSVFGANVQVFKRLLNLNFALELMETESKGKIVSAPKIITENNKKAIISSTEERQVRISNFENGQAVPALESISAEISLDVTPKVTNEGSIAMIVKLKKSGFGAQATADAIPNKVERSIDTNILVDNGSTVVIGGMFQTEDTKVESGVPFLKDLPLIGWLFRSAYNPKKSRNELIVFLTPRIINQEEAGLINRDLSDIGL